MRWRKKGHRRLEMDRLAAHIHTHFTIDKQGMRESAAGVVLFVGVCCEHAELGRSHPKGFQTRTARAARCSSWGAWGGGVECWLARQTQVQNHNEIKQHKYDFAFKRPMVLHLNMALALIVYRPCFHCTAPNSPASQSPSIWYTYRDSLGRIFATCCQPHSLEFR
jgi:hypothetical protein